MSELAVLQRQLSRIHERIEQINWMLEREGVPEEARHEWRREKETLIKEAKKLLPHIDAAAARRQREIMSVRGPNVLIGKKKPR